jgi:hypothetical protein
MTTPPGESHSPKEADSTSGASRPWRDAHARDELGLPWPPACRPLQAGSTTTTWASTDRQGLRSVRRGRRRRCGPPRPATAGRLRRPALSGRMWPVSWEETGPRVTAVVRCDPVVRGPDVAKRSEPEGALGQSVDARCWATAAGQMVLVTIGGPGLSRHIRVSTPALKSKDACGPDLQRRVTDVYTILVIKWRECPNRQPSQIDHPCSCPHSIPRVYHSPLGLLFL